MSKKSGVEYLAQHLGWKSSRKQSRKGSNSELAQALRSAASALEHGRYRTAKTKVKLVFDAIGEPTPDYSRALDSVHDQYVHDCQLSAVESLSVYGAAPHCTMQQASGRNGR